MNETIEALCKVPQYEQRSPEWFKQREGKCTSSNHGTVFGLNPYQTPLELLFHYTGVGKPFDDNPATRWGNHFEDEAIERYCDAHNYRNYDFGMIKYNWKPNRPRAEELYFLAGSPDGISIEKDPEDPDKDAEDGEPILIEVKCPFRRKIKYGQIPKYYYPQVQFNMLICDVQRADFIEYKPPQKGNSMVMNVVRVFRDDAWLYDHSLKLIDFWKNVEFWKDKGIQSHPEYQRSWKAKQDAKCVKENK